MPALSWLMNMGFAAGGTVVEVIYRRIVWSYRSLQSDTSLIKLNSELVKADDELVNFM